MWVLVNAVLYLQDCSVQIPDVTTRHSGRWVCSVLPINRGRMFLVSKPATLKVVPFESSYVPRGQFFVHF